MSEEERPPSAMGYGTGGGDGPTHVQYPRSHVRTVLQWTAVALTALIAFVFVATLVLSRTDWGRERVRRLVLDRLESVVNGQVTIGRVRGNLLRGATIDAFAIRDTAGQPFIAAEQVSARYSILQLFTRKIDLRDLRFVRPLIVLDRPPEGVWNYQRIFPPADTTEPDYVRRRGFPWIVFRDVTIIDGHIIMRTPWKPDTTLSRAAQNESIREALGGGKRIMVMPVANGYQKVVEIRDLTARAPLLRITQPGFDNRLAQVSSLRMEALPFRPPAAEVLDLVGNLHFNNDSLWWTNVAVRTPGSSLRGDGRYIFTGGDMTITARARPAALADFRWVLPRLPSEGGGPLDFGLEWRGTTQQYAIENADVRTQGARLRGSFAFTLADTLAIHDTDVRFTNVSTKLVEQLVPDFDSPRRGTLDGQLTILGGRNALQLAGNVAFHDQTAGTSRVSGSGTIGYAGNDFRFRDLRIRAQPLQVALLKAVAADADDPLEEIGGTLTGTLRLNGSTATSLAIAGDVEHSDRGGTSRFVGTAGIRMRGVRWFDIDVQARPLSLAEVGLLVPDLGLRGGASGPIRLRGTADNLRVSVALNLPGGGAVQASGSLDLGGRTKGYNLAGALRVVNLNAVMAAAPTTSLTASLRARGTGFEPATMSGAFAADFRTSSWRDVTIDSGVVRVSVGRGLARVDRLTLRGADTRIDAAGTFGLVAGRAGELRYSVAIDSLGAYNRWIPGADEPGVVRPRSGVVAMAVRRAREDSIRIARATEVERAATGRPMPRVRADIPRPVPLAALSGRVYAAGTLRGNVRDFDLRGRLSAENVLARGNAARSLRAEYAWTNVRTRTSQLAVAVQGGEVTLRGFAFDTLDGRLSYRRPAGEIQLALRQGEDRDYSMRGTFVVATQRELRLQDLALRVDTTIWRLAHEAIIHSHPAGIEVHHFQLVSNRGGLLYANGMLPTEGNANLVVEVQNFQVGDVTAMLQANYPLRGVVIGRGALYGSLRDPRFRGAAGIVNGSYAGSVIPNLQTTFAYANEVLVAHAEAIRPGAPPSAIAEASLPMNLALTGVSGPRLLDRTMRVDIRGDSLPLDLIPTLTDHVSQIRGRAAGTLAMRGTMQRPSMAGALTWRQGSLRIVTSGVTVHDIAASIRMAGDTVYVDSIAGRTGDDGRLRLAGHLIVGTWREPTFDLHLVANDAQVLNNDHGRLKADAGLRLAGPFRNAYLAGLVTIRQGVIRAPEPTSKSVIGANDPAVFAVIDTSVMYDRELFPVRSALLENLRMDVDVAVNRSTWLRTREANVEMFTEEPVRVNREGDALSLTGVVSTDRGEYTFLSKRFDIKRGSATFVGGPELNPTMQATGEYAVTIPGRPAFNVRVLIGGTMRRPKVSLESDAQPPISQSDLLSYLAFGQSTTSLLQIEGSGLTGATATGNLVGVGAALAMKRMTAVALGMMMDEVEGEATTGLGADVFNITPADIPTDLGNVLGFFEGTRVEVGKYFSPYFFLALQAQLQTKQFPGARAQYRTPKGWRFEGSVEPRYLLQPPRLAIQEVNPITSFGMFVIREWRF